MQTRGDEKYVTFTCKVGDESCIKYYPLTLCLMKENNNINMMTNIRLIIIINGIYLLNILLESIPMVILVFLPRL